ncbi:WD40 repeat domain-containing protein, partial [Nonomuraea sp. NPDC004297]
PSTPGPSTPGPSTPGPSTPGASAPGATGSSASAASAGDPAAELTDPAAAGTVELAHDVLLTAWPRLHSWLTEEHADRRLHSEICQDATEWDQTSRDASFLYRGVRLETAQHAAANWHATPGRHLTLPETATAFLHAGTRAATRTRHRWQAVFSGLAGFLVIAIITAVAAVLFGQEAERQATEAERQRTVALSSRIAADSQSWPNDAVMSARLAAAAWAIAQTDDARASMSALLSQPARGALIGHTDMVWSAVFSPDGKRLASASSDGTARIWDAVTRRQIGAPLTGHTDGVHSVAFSPDGTRLATASLDGTVRMWDTATGRPIGAPLTGHTGSVDSVAFSPDGKRLATVGYDRRATTTTRADTTVRIWDTATRRPIGAPLTGDVN